MSSDLKDLYQQVIVDHSKRPRNFRVVEGANRTVEGFNPLCGDKVTIFVRIEDDIVKDLSFQGSGCAISTASASLLTEALKGKTLREAEALFESFHDLVTGLQPEHQEPAKLGKLAVFSGVCDYPTRVKCATLAWHTLHAALKGDRKAGLDGIAAYGPTQRSRHRSFKDLLRSGDPCQHLRPRADLRPGRQRRRRCEHTDDPDCSGLSCGGNAARRCATRRFRP